MQDLLFSFEGRIRRSQWWVAQIGVTVIAAAAFVVLAMSFGRGGDVDVPMAAKLVVTTTMLVGIATMTWVNLATSTKRLHDQNLSGWFYLLTFIPLLGSFILLALLGFRDSTRGSNRYGPSAKYGDPAVGAVFE
jgi:uncharacterized membrane protein YhaH (DUF805 family)